MFVAKFDIPLVAPLSIDATVQGHAAKLILVGEIDVTNASRVAVNISGYVDSPPIALVVADLSSVSFIDSSGLRALTSARTTQTNTVRPSTCKTHACTLPASSR